jgi:inhibitor of cysteine peptidase
MARPSGIDGLLLVGALACAVGPGCRGGGVHDQPTAEAEAAAPSQPAQGPSSPDPARDAGAQPPAQGAAGEVAIGAPDAGRQVELARGQTLVLTLESNPSTGYSWAVTRGDETVLHQAGDPVFRQGGAPGVVGAPGAEVFRFEAVAAGAVDLELGYRRPWEAGQPPARTFSARIVVR